MKTCGALSESAYLFQQVFDVSGEPGEPPCTGSIFGKRIVRPEKPQHLRHVGLTAAEEAGVVTTRLRFREPLVGNRNLPAVHGGVLGAFLELTSVIQLLHEGAYAHLPKTVDISFQYLRSAGPHDMYGRAHITRRGRRVASVRAEIWQQDPEKLTTLAYGHFLLTPV